MNRALLIVPLVLACSSLTAPDAAAGDLASRILAMTGARTKIVWAHQVRGGNRGHWGGGAASFELMAFDTEDGKKRMLLPGPISCGNPSITPDGKRVVYTDSSSGKIRIVNWHPTEDEIAGKAEPNALASGFALCTWADPKTGIQWVYMARGEFVPPITRFQIDNPEVKEVVWDKACSATNGFGISADGTRAGSMFPWPNAGVAILPNVSFKRYGRGCEGCLAPDNSYRFFHMGERAGHSGVMMYDTGGANKRLVRFDNFPGRGRQDSWNARWSTDVRFLTVSSPNSGIKQEVYLGEFDEKFTRVKRWIQITDTPGQDLVSHAWIDPGLGHQSGEVPLTVEIAPPDQRGKWRLDYGDGTSAKVELEPVKHTYAKAGDYTLIARRGKTVVKGSVVARPRKAPEVVSVRLMDESRLLVRFDEPVRLQDAAASLESGTTIPRMKLDKLAPKLTIHLGGKLAASDTLHLKGVFDLAQVPNAMANASVKIVRPAWPADRTDLVFLWETAAKDSFQYDPIRGEFSDTRLTAKKLARLDRHGAMVMRGGTYLAMDAANGIVRLIKRTSQFTIEAVITPDNLYQGRSVDTRRIIASHWGAGNKEINFAIDQEAEVLVLYLRLAGKPERIELCELDAAAPNHVVVTYSPGRLVCHLNGKSVLDTDEAKGKLLWRRVAYSLSIGGGPKTLATWCGTVEGFAIFSRAISPAQAVADFKAYNKVLSARKRLERTVVRAKLRAKSQVPTAAEIAPYISAVVVNEFDVLEVVSGKYAPKKIRIAQWGLVNRRVSETSLAPIGTTGEIAVERFADHPELEAEVTRDTLGDDFDLPLYYDVTIRPSGRPKPTVITVTPRQVWMPAGGSVLLRATVYDQYGVRLFKRLKWTVLPGGNISPLSHGGGGRYLLHKDAKAAGTVGSRGRFTSDADSRGVVTVSTVAAEDKRPSAARGEVTVAVGDYPAILPAPGPLHFGADARGQALFTGDIDRVRIYNRALTAAEVAANKLGRKLTTRGLVGDWTFDKLIGGKFPNVAVPAGGKPMPARIVGDIQHVKTRRGGYLHADVTTNGYAKVADDPRLMFSQACTIEAWIRPGVVPGVIAAKSVPRSRTGFRLDVEGGVRVKSMHGWLKARHMYPDDSTARKAATWTHVVGVCNVNGEQRIYINGKPRRTRKPAVLIVKP